VNIIPSLMPMAVDITALKPLNGNPRRGDVDAVARSLQQFGQRKPIVARRFKNPKAGQPTGEVIAGNHTLQAAIQLGWDEIAVAWTDDDAATAKAFALADNRTHDIGSYDDRALAEMLSELQGLDELLQATAYNEGEMADLLALLDPQEEDGQTPSGMGQPVIGYSIIFDDETQQKAWYSLMRWLREKYPDSPTNGERLALHSKEVTGES
jgi:ParB-like chromosome segregation protein Spo0J